MRVVSDRALQFSKKLLLCNSKRANEGAQSQTSCKGLTAEYQPLTHVFNCMKMYCGLIQSDPPQTYSLTLTETANPKKSGRTKVFRITVLSGTVAQRSPTHYRLRTSNIRSSKVLIFCSQASVNFHIFF